MGLQHLEKTNAVRIPSRKITLTCSLSVAGWPRNSSRIYVPNLRFSGAEDKKDCSSNAYLCTKYILYNKLFCIQVLNCHLLIYRGSSISTECTQGKSKAYCLRSVVIEDCIELIDTILQIPIFLQISIKKAYYCRELRIFITNLKPYNCLFDWMH